jgi:hypothetical protein
MSLATSPLSVVTTTMRVESAVVNGLSLSVAWKTDDIKLFPSDAVPTLDPTWHLGLSPQNKIAIGGMYQERWNGHLSTGLIKIVSLVGVGVGVPVLTLAGMCFFCGRRWSNSIRRRRERTTQQPLPAEKVDRFRGYQ